MLNFNNTYYFKITVNGETTSKKRDREVTILNQRDANSIVESLKRLKNSNNVVDSDLLLILKRAENLYILVLIR